VVTLITGVKITSHPHSDNDVHVIATIVVVCFVIGIGRSWELIGGPSIGLRRELAALVVKDDDESE
jgi:hypothetical protein